MPQTIPLRWGILGCASIARRAVVPGIRASRTGVVAAVASRSLDKAEAFAEAAGIPQAYGSYEALLDDPDIDAVYIPLPNHLHKEWTIRAAQAGKHVLCEKPAALNADEAREMVEACRQAGVHFAEAFMYRHHPRYRRIREIIASGEIGAIRGIHGAFTFNNAGDSANVRYRRDWGGGSLYDVGVYPISAARYILGTEPEAATVHAYFSPEHDGVDMMASGLIEFHGSVALTFDCGMWAHGRNTLEILGTEGRIELPSAYVCPPDRPSAFDVVVRGERRTETMPAVNQYALQADDFAEAVWGGAALFPADDAVRGMAVIDACLKSARERARVAL
ncbi:Gfo/Idh/MocA family protein [Paenibacillus thermoaerophilus]|uniref:Gfo/Idh/MocA family protein n=1 Tax=Paenibacillus thermoaerophilus TaxID=1215385 RepID=A0ABW2V5V2_9BACL|nr:Gfo/Idh/MocA family oxidoreductase [Paenibacillus thermoaerophilus]TMV17698.1 Gfo/Idh/MocA family oxidoreductase [Paenibacillus thermoaerophilus]